MIYSLKISTSNLSDFLLIQRLLVSLGVVSIKVVSLPKTIKRFVFIKSPHVNASSKEHFQIVKYRRLFYINFSLPSLKNFLINLPNTLSISIKKIK
jgi:ribosomal protein S10